ncbi:MAG: hypothetical protein QXK71_00575 [Pyrobaculum sp.]|jgi:tRNA threonylcarbamoyladenosine modification (KEOPS) complex  Pcc1 subunit
MYKLILNVNDEFILRIFKILEQEVRFPRGRLYVENGKVVVVANDASSLRSLTHTIFRTIYIAESIKSLEMFI